MCRWHVGVCVADAKAQLNLTVLEVRLVVRVAARATQLFECSGWPGGRELARILRRVHTCFRTAWFWFHSKHWKAPGCIGFITNVILWDFLFSNFMKYEKNGFKNLKLFLNT